MVIPYVPPLVHTYVKIDSTGEVNAVDVNVIYPSIIHNDENMLCKAVKDSYFKAYPKYFPIVIQIDSVAVRKIFSVCFSISFINSLTIIITNSK